MDKSRGEMKCYELFNVAEMGLGNSEPDVDLTIKAFLAIGEAIAARWVQMPRGILILQMAPENPASGAIYVYDRRHHNFYMLGFEGAEDTLTVEEFTELLSEYDLLRYAEQPKLLGSYSSKIEAA